MIKIGRNDKCPCGSDKKHKYCCLDNTGKLSEFDEIEYLKQFTPLSVVLWLQVVICHPNNALYLHRLYFLLGLAFSIPEPSFGKKEMSYEDVKKLFDCIEESYSKTFFMLEDFEGFDQVKLIPLFLNQKKYYFFYGNFERPHEHLRQLTDTYFFNDESIEEGLYKFQREILDSLEFQTRLLENLKNKDENSIKQEMLYIPTSDYYNIVSPHFMSNEYSMLPSVSHRLGDLIKLTTQEIFDKSIEMSLFDKTHIDIHGQLVWITPHIHLNIFINEGQKILEQKLVLEQQTHANYKTRLNNLCRTFFSNRKEILAILEKDTNANILEGNVDFAIIIDSNKLLLFACVDYSHKYDITNKLNKKLSQLSTLRKKILSADVVGIFEYGSEFAYGIYTKALEIWLIPIYEPICLDVLASITKDVDLTQIFMFGYMDLRAVFGKIDTPLKFLKFLKEDDTLLRRMNGPIMGEFMDRFYFYIQNGHSHMRSGRTFDTGMFEFHMWSDHIFDEYWKKYQDTAYDEIELKHPDFFNKIDKYKEGVYRMVNTADLSASYLIKWNDRFIWSYLPPVGHKLEYMELHIGVELVAPMICDYIMQFENQFENILSSNGINPAIEYSFAVLPKSLIDNTPEFARLKEDSEQLNEDNPIVFRTSRIGFRKVRTFVIYDYKLFPKLFSLPQNIGERYTIKFLVKNIIEFYKKDSSDSENIAENFINTNLPIGIKGYSVEEHSVLNANVNSYEPPISFNETEIAITERIISEYLIQNDVQPGDYKGKEAREINYKIYTFLQNRLQNEISQFDKQFIIYAYKQLELAEGERYLKKIALGMRSKGRTDYDLLKSTQQTEYKSSQLNVCIKHIIHTVLKTGRSGTDFMTGEIWTKLIALADAIISAGTISDYIEYNLREHTLKITNDYLIEDILGEEVIDSEKLHIKNTEIKIERAKRAHTKAIENPKHTEDKKLPEVEIPTELDIAFKKDLGFSFTDLTFVLYVLSILPLANEVHFPVNIRSTHELFFEINKNDPKEISEETVDLILNFLCLYDGVFKPTDLLYPSDMMRNKERINVSPFLKLEDNLFLYGNEVVRTSLNFWSYLDSGDFPFVNESYPNIKTAIENIHRKEDLALEKLAEEKVVEILGRNNVVARINNFKQLSETFKRNEDCGEIDILCANKNTKVLFVIDAKNINKKVSVYHINKSIKDFFDGKKSYYSKLLKKRNFVEQNMLAVLNYFGVNDSADWKVIEAFVSEEVYFASYYKKIKVDFVLVKDLEAYLCP